MIVLIKNYIINIQRCEITEGQQRRKVINASRTGCNSETLLKQNRSMD